MEMQLGFVLILALCVGGLRGDQYDTTYRNYGDGESTERNQNQHHSNAMLCMDIKPQHSVDIEHITGMWYGTEIIVHTQDVPGVYNYNSCVIVHISDNTAQMQNNNNYNGYRQGSTLTHQYNRQQQPQQSQQQHERERQYLANDYSGATKYLRLIWSEKDDNLEYSFNYTEHSPGVWTNVGEQRGSLVSLNHYTQFTGTVQVVKAVNDHLVLTFCGNDIKSSIYTLVLTRTKQGLSDEELRSIRGLLSRRGLYTETIRKVCTSASASAKTLASTVLFFMLAAVASIFRKHH